GRSVGLVPGGPPVEVLAHLVPQRRGHGAVDEAAGEQLHLGPRAGERGAEGPVVRWRVGGRIDDLDAHSPGFWRWSSPTAWSTPTGEICCSSACGRSARPTRRAPSTRSWSWTTPPTTGRWRRSRRASRAFG